MGYAYDHFVVPALLELHPGCTFEEFGELLNSARHGIDHEYFNPKHKDERVADRSLVKNGFQGKEGVHYHRDQVRNYEVRHRLTPWDCRHLKDTPSRRYNAGLYSVAHQLDLKLTREYKEWEQAKEHKGFFGETCGERYFMVEPISTGSYEYANHPGYYVTRIEGYTISSREEIEKRFAIDADTKLKPGKVVTQRWCCAPYYLERVIKDYRPKKQYATVVVRELAMQKSTRLFETQDELIRQHPELAPRRMYDFTQPDGIITCNSLDAKVDFRWYRQNGKLYLDRESYQRQFNKQHSLFGEYTDFVVTTQAVKHNAWRLLGRSTAWQIPLFFKRFPDAVPVHAKAVWDQETSKLAMREKMTHFELLRTRLLAGVHSTNASLARRAAALTLTPKLRIKAPGPQVPPQPVPDPEVPF